MFRSNARRWAAGGLAATVLVAGAGFARLSGEDKPAAKADKPAADPKDVRVGPPPELAELRQAVEEAAKAGENVAEIRKQLEALEKALAGKAWVKPKPVDEPPATPTPPTAFPGNFNRVPQGRGGMIQPPVVIGGLGAVEADMARLQAELLRELAQRDALLGGRMGALDARGVRLADARLGVRIEKPAAALADQLDLPAGRGVVVTEVRPGSPADKAGLKTNDVIVEFAGRPVSDNVTDFVRSVETAPRDGKVDLTVMRKGKKETLKGVSLPENGRRADAPPAPFVPPVAGRAGLPAPPAPEAPPAVRVAPPARIAAIAPIDLGAAGTVAVRISDGMFMLTAEADGVRYVIEGTVGEKATPSKVRITDGDKPKVEVDTLEKVPAEYRKQVEKLLNGVRPNR